MSKDSFYFSHDYNARSDPKIKRLISKHGIMGYGLYWSIIEDLYMNANALPLHYDVIAFDMRCEEDVVRSIINDFDLFLIDGDEFGSLSIQRRLDIRDNKSAKARESAHKRWEKNNNNANAMQTQCDSNAIKGKERKGKDIIEKKILSKPDKPVLPKNDFIDQVIDQFCQSHGNYQVINRGKERQAAGRLVGIHKEKFPESTSEETLVGLRTYFNKCNKISDNWLRTNMSLSLIVSKFNEINIILNGKSTGKNGQHVISDDFKRNLVERIRTSKREQTMP